MESHPPDTSESPELPPDPRLARVRERQANRRELLGAAPVRHLILVTLGVPSLIAMLFLASYHLADAAFVGHSSNGSLAVAALSVGSIVETFNIALAFILGIGSNNIISAAIGRGDFAYADLVFGTMLTITLVLSLLLPAVLVPQAEGLAKLLGASPEVVPEAARFLRVTSSNFLFYSMQISVNNVLRAAGEPLWALASNITAAVVNVAIDPVFIFVCDLGAMGAALGTVCGTFASGIVGMFPIVTGRTAISLRGRCLLPSREGARISAKILQFGLPQGLGQLADGCSTLFATTFISRHAPDYSQADMMIASFGAAQKLARLVQQPVNGVNQALLPVLALAQAAGAPGRFRHALKVALVFALSFAGSVALLIFSTASYVPFIFNSEPEFVEQCAVILRFFFGLIWVYALAAPINFALQVTHHTVISNMLTTWRRLLAYVPSTYIIFGCLRAMGRKADDVKAIYYSLPLAEGSGAIVSLGIAALFRKDLHLVKSADKPFSRAVYHQLAAKGCDTRFVEHPPPTAADEVANSCSSSCLELVVCSDNTSGSDRI